MKLHFIACVVRNSLSAVSYTKYTVMTREIVIFNLIVQQAINLFIKNKNRNNSKNLDI